MGRMVAASLAGFCAALILGSILLAADHPALSDTFATASWACLVAALVFSLLEGAGSKTRKETKGEA